MFFARFCKTREVAATLISGGGVRVNRQIVEKPHAKLRVGDVLTMAGPRKVMVIEVLGLGKRREAAPLARLLYREIGES